MPKLPNSTQSMNEAFRSLQEISRSQGSPSIFVTYSSAEHKWPDAENAVLGENFSYQPSGYYKSRLDLGSKLSVFTTQTIIDRFTRVSKTLNEWYPVKW